MSSCVLLRADFQATASESGLATEAVGLPMIPEQYRRLAETLNRFLEKGWLNQPTLFVRFFEIARPLPEEIITIDVLGCRRCFGAPRGPENIVWRQQTHMVQRNRVPNCFSSQRQVKASR